MKPIPIPILESPMRKSLELADCSLKEEVLLDETSILVIMQSIFDKDKHLFRKTQANKIIKLDIQSKKLAEFLENNSIKLRGCRI